MGAKLLIGLVGGLGALVAGAMLSPVPLRSAEVKDCYTSRVTPTITFKPRSGVWVKYKNGAYELGTPQEKQQQIVSEIGRVLKILERVPDSLQKIGYSPNEWQNLDNTVDIFDDTKTVRAIEEFYYLRSRAGTLAFAFHNGGPAIIAKGADEELILHEYGHLRDSALGKLTRSEKEKISLNTDFTQLYEREKERLVAGIGKYGESAYPWLELYAITNPGEYFAVGFSVYYGSKEDEKTRMKSAYPETWKYFESLDSRFQAECPTKKLKGFQLLGKTLFNDNHEEDLKQSFKQALKPHSMRYGVGNKPAKSVTQLIHPREFTEGGWRKQVPAAT